MRGNSLWAILLLAVLAITSVNADVSDPEYQEIPTECPAVDPLNTTIHLAHETNCELFYACSNGRPILMACGDRDSDGNKLHFDPVQQVCVWPEDSNCTNVEVDNSTTDNSEIDDSTTEENVTDGNSDDGNSDDGDADDDGVSDSNPDGGDADDDGVPDSNPDGGDADDDSVSDSNPDGGDADDDSVPDSNPDGGDADDDSVPDSNPDGGDADDDSVPDGNGDDGDADDDSVPDSNPDGGDADDDSVPDSNPDGGDADDDSVPDGNGDNGDADDDSVPDSNPDGGDADDDSVPDGNGDNGDADDDSTTEDSVQENNPDESNTDDSGNNEDDTNSSADVETTTEGDHKEIPTTCPPTNEGYAVHIAHEYNCSLFYICNFGDKVLLTCPHGLEFNAYEQVCDWPGASGCVAGVPPPQSVDSEESSESSGSGNSSETEDSGDASNEHKEIPTVCPPTNEGYAVHIAHEYNCSLFYKCNFGDKVEMECPDNLEFNARLQVCDWPRDSGCVWGTPPTTESAEESSESEGSDNDRNEDSESGTSAEVDDSPVLSINCPLLDSVYLPHSDCSKFWQCSNGTPYLFTCPSGLYFNKNEGRCDWPESSGCVQA